MNPRARFRSLYGAGPLSLLSGIAMFAFVGYVLVQVFDGLYPWNFLLWFVGAIVIHDLVGFPLYSLLDRVAGHGIAPLAVRAQVRAINYLRVPAIVSGIFFVVWFPLILGLDGDLYEGITGLSPDVYLARWLGITAVLFGCSAFLYAIRVRRARRSAPKG